LDVHDISKMGSLQEVLKCHRWRWESYNCLNEWAYIMGCEVGNLIPKFGWFLAINLVGFPNFYSYTIFLLFSTNVKVLTSLESAKKKKKKKLKECKKKNAKDSRN
jgi:hypothetical protein